MHMHVLMRDVKEERKKQARSLYIMFLCQSVNPVLHKLSTILRSLYAVTFSLCITRCGLSCVQ